MPQDFPTNRPYGKARPATPGPPVTPGPLPDPPTPFNKPENIDEISVIGEASVNNWTPSWEIITYALQ